MLDTMFELPVAQRRDRVRDQQGGRGEPARPRCKIYADRKGDCGVLIAVVRRRRVAGSRGAGVHA